MASQSPYLKNCYEEYSASKVPSILNEARNELSSTFQESLQAFTKNKLVFMNTEMENDIFYDNTVYTGSAGFGLFYFMRAITDDNVELLKQSLTYINIKQLKGKRITFLCGDSGPLALATVISYKLGNRANKKPHKLPDYRVIAERLLSLISLLNECPDEVLYGKAGYLYALLFVKKYIPDDTVIPPDHIKKVVKAIIKSGRHYSTQVNSESPLLWQWHDKVYLGAAHGVAGILYMLLQAHEYLEQSDMSEYVEPTLKWLLRQRLNTGNYPSSLGGAARDRLVQWCHGAPGFVPLCILAYKHFKNDKYLKIAKECGEVVWRRGLCAKGFSLCHGVAGNAYTFVQLYQATEEPVHLYRAGCFMEWCVSERAGSQARPPDRPASLFEGLPGRLYLAEELNHIDTAKFPAFEL